MEIKPKILIIVLGILVFIVAGIFLYKNIFSLEVCPEEIPPPEKVKIEDIYKAGTHVHIEGTVIEIFPSMVLLEDEGYVIFVRVLEPENIALGDRIWISGEIDITLSGFSIIAKEVRIIDHNYPYAPPLEVGAEFITTKNWGKSIILKNQTLIDYSSMYIEGFGPALGRDFYVLNFGYWAIIPKNNLDVDIAVGNQYDIHGFVMKDPRVILRLFDMNETLIVSGS